MTYDRDELLKKLHEVCKKYDISNYELDIKLSESLLKNFSMDEIKKGSIIIKALDKLLSKNP